jgi:hypothetical protein
LSYGVAVIVPRAATALVTFAVLLAGAGARAAGGAALEGGPLSPDQLGAALPVEPVPPEAELTPGTPPTPAERVREGAFAARHVFTFAAGLAWARFSDRPVDEPALLSVVAEWRWRTPLGLAGRWSADAGVRGAMLRIPYATLAGDEVTSAIWSAVLTGRLSRRLGRSLELGVGAAAGLAAWAGLGPMNPFTVAGAAATGAVPMLTVEATAELTYVTPLPHVALSVLSRYVASSTTTPGLVRTVPHMTHLDVLAGVGVRWY